MFGCPVACHRLLAFVWVCVLPAVNTTIVDGRLRSAFGVSAITYITSIRVSQVFITVVNTSVLDYEALSPDYRIPLTLTTVDLGGHYVNSSLVSGACVFGTSQPVWGAVQC